MLQTSISLGIVFVTVIRF